MLLASGPAACRTPCGRGCGRYVRRCACDVEDRGSQWGAGANTCCRGYVVRGRPQHEGRGAGGMLCMLGRAGPEYPSWDRRIVVKTTHAVRPRDDVAEAGVARSLKCTRGIAMDRVHRMHVRSACMASMRSAGASNMGRMDSATEVVVVRDGCELVTCHGAYGHRLACFTQFEYLRLTLF